MRTNVKKTKEETSRTLATLNLIQSCPTTAKKVLSNCMYRYFICIIKGARYNWECNFVPRNSNVLHNTYLLLLEVEQREVSLLLVNQLVLDLSDVCKERKECTHYMCLLRIKHNPRNESVITGFLKLYLLYLPISRKVRLPSCRQI